MSRSITSSFLLTVFCGLASVATFGTSASAHEAWLEPLAYKIEVGGELTANYKIGSNYKGNAQPFISSWHREFKITLGSMFAEITGEDGQRPSVQILDAREGLNILTLHTSTSKLKFNKWEKFTTYLDAQGISEIAVQHLKHGLPKEGFTEGYRRNAKALVQVGDRQGADKAIGLPFEFVVVDGLYGTGEEPIVIELLWQGKPQVGAQVQVWDSRNKKKAGEEGAEDPQQAYFTTDDQGRFSFAPAIGGAFMMSSVHMVPGIEGETSEVKYEWDSFWANLTFSR